MKAIARREFHNQNKIITMAEQNNQEQNPDFTTNRNRAGKGAAEEEQNPGAQQPEGTKNKGNNKKLTTGSHAEGAENTQNRNSGMHPGSLNQ